MRSMKKKASGQNGSRKKWLVNGLAPSDRSVNGTCIDDMMSTTCTRNTNPGVPSAPPPGAPSYAARCSDHARSSSVPHSQSSAGMNRQKLPRRSRWWRLRYLPQVQPIELELTK
jgi:hypothetical protein